MRKKISTLIFAVFIFGMVCCLEGCKKQKVAGFKEIQKIFPDPGNEFRSSPLLVFNEDVTKTEIDRMVGDLHNAGFGGLFIHIYQQKK